MEDKDIEKDKVIIEDPRTIYSLSMFVILYEVYNKLNPDILVNQNNTLLNTLLTSLIDALKSIFFLLLFTQFLFLLVRGLSLADINADDKKYLLYLSDRIYASGFQFSIILLIVGALLAILSIIFDLLKIPIKLWIVVLFILLPVTIAVYSWTRWFWKNNVAHVASQTPPKRVKSIWFWYNFTNILISTWVVIFTLTMIYFFSKSVKLF